VLVPVPVVEGVTVAVMEVVDVVAVRNGFVAAARAVLVVTVVGVLGVHVAALVPVPVVQVMHVTVVEVVGVLAVGDRRVPATGAVLMGVVLVNGVGGGHDDASSACRIASRTMWVTCLSAIT
jgi:hypothetical protein